jgi:hypothetical protein
LIYYKELKKELAKSCKQDLAGLSCTCGSGAVNTGSRSVVHNRIGLPEIVDN